MHIRHLDWRTHTHIGLDLDETLAATMSGMLAYAHSVGALRETLHIDQIRKHDASGLGSGITPEEAVRLWEAYGKSTISPESVPPIDSAIEWVRKIHEHGKKISIVTARSDRESWKVERTKLWVRGHFSFLSESDIFFVNHFSEEARPKSEVCKNERITLMIDDAIENAYELCEAGIASILLEKPWNKYVEWEHPLLYRAHDWQEIIQSISHDR